MISEKKKKDIENIVLDALSKTGSLGVYPTPVDKILRYSELRVDTKVDLARIPKNFFAKSELLIRSGLAKVRGVLDRREKIIYLDLNQLEQKQRFVKLHEAGHELLTWQNKLHDFLDDDETLDPDIKELFEAEANFFASASLFQLSIFGDKMREYPLEISSAIQLAKTFGSSIHASLRRYVETNKKKCALLVLNKGENVFSLPTLRNYFQSESFTNSIGELDWKDQLTYDSPFVQDYLSNRRFYQSSFDKIIEGKPTQFNYHYFFNKYNIFIFLFPKGEVNKSRTTFITAS